MINYDSFRTPTNRMRIFFLSSILLFAVSTTIFSQDVKDLDLKVLFTNELHEDNKLWQSNIKFAPNGKYFLVNNREEIAVIDSKKFRVKSICKSPSEIFEAYFVDDKNVVASFFRGEADNLPMGFQVWNALKGTPTKTQFITPWTQGNGQVRSALGQKDQLVMYGNQGGVNNSLGTIAVWDLKSKKLMQEKELVRNRIGVIHINPMRPNVALVLVVSGVLLFKVDDLSTLAEFGEQKNALSGHVCFTPDGKNLLMGRRVPKKSHQTGERSYDEVEGFTVDSYDLKHKKGKRFVVVDDASNSERIRDVLSIELTPTGKHLLVVSNVSEGKQVSTGVLEFFDIATGKLDFRKTTRHNIYDIEFHPQGNQLAMISGKEQTNERVLTVFDTQDTFGVPKADKPSKRKKKNRPEPKTKPQPEPKAEPVEYQTRTWTSAKGTSSVEATFISASTTSVKIRKPDGKILTVPLDQLSGADREYVKTKKK